MRISRYTFKYLNWLNGYLMSSRHDGKQIYNIYCCQTFELYNKNDVTLFNNLSKKKEKLDLI